MEAATKRKIEEAVQAALADKETEVQQMVEMFEAEAEHIGTAMDEVTKEHEASTAHDLDLQMMHEAHLAETLKKHQKELAAMEASQTELLNRLEAALMENETAKAEHKKRITAIREVRLAGIYDLFDLDSSGLLDADEFYEIGRLKTSS